jgi:hypothetical protein
MTAVAAPPVEPAPAPETPAPKRFSLRQLFSTAALIMAGMLLGYAVYVGFCSQLYFDRAQHTAYDDFRTELIQGIAPVSQRQPMDPTKLLPLGATVAVLDIPEIGQHDVVFEGTTGEVLESGPGHRRDTVLPGQAGTSVILGRAATYGGPFGRISQLHKGDTFSVTTGQAVSNFRVIDVRHAGDRQPAPAVGGGRLVLTTADGPAYLPSDVLRVDADLVSATLPTPGPTQMSHDLPPNEMALASDSSAWLPVVLWGQGLLVAAFVITWARTRWGRWQVWIVAVPVLGVIGLAVADQASRLLLNLT